MEEEPAAQAPTAAPSDARSHRATVEEVLDEGEPIREAYPGAARIIRWDPEVHRLYEEGANGVENPWHPFATKMEWEIAKWAKESNTEDSTLNKLLTIPGASGKTSSTHKVGIRLL